MSPSSRNQGALQVASEDFWRQSSDTYLGTPGYYAHKEQELKALLATLPKFENAVDLGCGDGRYTLLMAAHAARIEGRDISPELIAAAKAQAAELDVGNVRFTVATVLDPLPAGAFDLIAVLGVTSCVIDDGKYEALLDEIAEALAPRGCLILIDSVSTKGDELLTESSGYVARYRDVRLYRDAVRRRGLTLVHEIDLSAALRTWKRRLVPIPPRKTNRLFLFRA